MSMLSIFWTVIRQENNQEYSYHFIQYSTKITQFLSDGNSEEVYESQSQT
jgi:hypothetical protein